MHNYDQVNKKKLVIVSVDIPSGWHVEEGDVDGEGIKPDMLVMVCCESDVSPSKYQKLAVTSKEIQKLKSCFYSMILSLMCLSFL